MKTTSAYTLLSCILATISLAHGLATCISDSEVSGIAQRWLNAFATGGLSTLSSAVTENIHIYDEGASNGSTIPYVQNYTQLYNTIASSAYGGGGVTNVTYGVIFTYHTCDHIALRWQENAYTTDDVGYGSTVEAGKYIEFKGTDLLTIDVASGKVMNATTSSDLLNYYRELGYPLGVWSAN